MKAKAFTQFSREPHSAENSFLYHFHPDFGHAVEALRRLTQALRIEALAESVLRDRDVIVEQNEAGARKAGYPNLISMQYQSAEKRRPSDMPVPPPRSRPRHASEE